jgi:ubiquinone/menaquinone biosynthesis C-methylase UbiE
MARSQAPPNHHADDAGFAGVTGLIAALSMAVGRKGDARLAVRLSDLHRGDTVVDVGCGPGVAVRYAAGQGATVTGVDPAPIMLRVARKLTQHSSMVRYLEGVAEAIPLPVHSASIVWSIATVHHWADVDAGLREVRRVLSPGGRLVAIERETKPGARGRASHGWSPQQAADFMERCIEHEFTDARVERVTSGRRSTVSVVASVL